MSYYSQHPAAFGRNYLEKLRKKIPACPYFTVNNLNRDFVGTKGFSLVFRRSHLEEVEKQFPYFKNYLDRAILPDCNAFYLNPLLLKTGSRVDPHIDRSLRSYCKTIDPPATVSVLYIDVPENLRGGELVLKHGNRAIGSIEPEIGKLIYFQGDLTHSVNPVTGEGNRLSLVCEQYDLVPEELEEIPEFLIESRTLKKEKKRLSIGASR